MTSVKAHPPLLEPPGYSTAALPATVRITPMKLHPRVLLHVKRGRWYWPPACPTCEVSPAKFLGPSAVLHPPYPDECIWSITHEGRSLLIPRALEAPWFTGWFAGATEPVGPVLRAPGILAACALP